MLNRTLLMGSVTFHAGTGRNFLRSDLERGLKGVSPPSAKTEVDTSMN